MDEFIEELWEKYSDDYDIRKTEFAEAIQTACQAQRNACARDYQRYGDRNNIMLTVDYIQNAEITKEDYE